MTIEDKELREVTLSGSHNNAGTVKPVLSGRSKIGINKGLKDRLLLNAGRKYCRMLQMEHSAILWTCINR